MHVGSSRFKATMNSAPLISNGNNTVLTDKDRDEIDFEAKTIIRQTMDRIKKIEDLEKERRARARKTGFLERLVMRPEEEAMSVLLSTHRGAITWYLSKKLSEASDIQRIQQEVRLMREVEKSKSMINSRPLKITQPMTTTSRASKAIEVEKQFESTLSQEQLQVLEQENNSMLEGFERTLDQIKGAEKALLEISALQNELMTQLMSQAYITDRLYDDALDTTASVEKGNEQLVRAKKRHKSTTQFVLVFLLVMTLMLLFLDSWY